MTGRIAVIIIAVSALLAGVVMYWMQVYGFYRVLPLDEAAVQTIALSDGTLAALITTEAEAIDADSSPIRYRACLTLADPPDPATLVPYPDANPLTAPGWFDCFDAAVIGAGLEAGTTRAYLAERDHKWGIDRVIALPGDGRAYVWPQINRCGMALFDGKPVPPDCPPPPARE